MYMLSNDLCTRRQACEQKCTKSTEENRKTVYQKYRGIWKCAQIFKVKQFTVFRINSIRTV